MLLGMTSDNQSTGVEEPGMHAAETLGTWEVCAFLGRKPHKGTRSTSESELSQVVLPVIEKKSNTNQGIVVER